MTVSRDVCEAVYGYRSQVRRMPRARASAMTETSSSILCQLRLPAVFRCDR
ncbi:hypothetical protein MBAV_004349 [Candidatus Magnetobacterium bavaricum]|uniref:Uncharacterized protein n=1 Tax=Candidatus Magnetobacterium bavaricum TaxID=29290 RepID=A0A0F3GNS1_9BACT|nr:hypothetical protein MBAV_004349 [Candidatus Magnetobacterium bavaricum]